jgi:hypothetical protein
MLRTMTTPAPVPPVPPVPPASISGIVARAETTTMNLLEEELAADTPTDEAAMLQLQSDFAINTAAAESLSGVMKTESDTMKAIDQNMG